VSRSSESTRRDRRRRQRRRGRAAPTAAPAFPAVAADAGGAARSAVSGGTGRSGGGESLRWEPPRTAEELHGFVRTELGLDVPRIPLVPGHAAPFDYLLHTFFEDSPGPRDCVVWANRGGGKTALGAAATLLDMLFKPGIQVRVLAGSFDQSSRMYAHVRDALSREPFASMVRGHVTGRFVEFINRSRLEVLSQSQRSVRGQRVHRIRCDEVELFDDGVWTAAQLVTRSGRCGGIHVRGGVEAISTMHRPYGLMKRLVEEANRGDRRLFRWSVLDVLEHCPPARACGSCPLWGDCAGRARQARGFVAIDDAIAQMSRVSREAWSAEMLCERPSTADRVFPEFDASTHVRPFDAARFAGGRWVAGIDFGYRAPTVLLWAWLDPARDVLHVVDEHVEAERTVRRHIDAARSRPWPAPEWIAADPAGNARNDQSGVSTIRVWREAGFRVRWRSATIEEGVELVRARLRAADGSVRLVIHPRCARLIESLVTYHFDPADPLNPAPVKDGPDHAADALRYLVAMLDTRSGEVVTRGY